MATLQNIGKLKYRGKDGLWHPLPVVVQDTGGGVSTISGKGAPTSETQGKVNQLYRDEDTQRLYICVDAADGVYTWAPVSGGTSGASDWNGVSGKPFETVGEGLAVDSGKKLRVSEVVMQEIAGKVDRSTLQTAVDNALEEAKTSGAFDGADGKSAYEIAVEQGFTGTAEEWIASLQGADGVSPHIGGNGNWWIGSTDTSVKAQGEKGDKGDTPVKGTDYFTNADKQEIAESAAGMVDIPDKLPNPNALTFTGAVSGIYDGSAPLSVNIPSGGGSGGGGTDVALGMSGASVGQIAKITAVDESGVPTSWEPVDLPSGGGSVGSKPAVIFDSGEITEEVSLIGPIDVSQYSSVRIFGKAYPSANSAGKKAAQLYFGDIKKRLLCNVGNNKLFDTSGNPVAFVIYLHIGANAISTMSYSGYNAGDTFDDLDYAVSSNATFSDGACLVYSTKYNLANMYLTAQDDLSTRPWGVGTRIMVIGDA